MLSHAIRESIERCSDIVELSRCRHGHSALQVSTGDLLRRTGDGA